LEPDEKLQALRELFSKPGIGIDAYIIPSQDAHQVRLFWLNFYLGFCFWCIFLLKFNWVLDVFMHLYWCLNVIVI
jgi:hypothetical protein